MQPVKAANALNKHVSRRDTKAVMEEMEFVLNSYLDNPQELPLDPKGQICAKSACAPESRSREDQSTLLSAIHEQSL